jgi:hypothetical protein
MEQEQQVFTLRDLTGQDIDAIMNGLNELQTKIARPTMNKLEMQIVQQVVAAQQAAQGKDAAPPAPPAPPAGQTSES